MADDIAIRVKNLGKRYKLGQQTGGYKTLGETITRAVKSPFQRLQHLDSSEEKEEAGTFWALRDVSFEVKKGEVIGIIGRNGAGKSTLLKILSRITAPTEGTVEVHGRIGSLLEVGTGFHPELTGRENIFLSGSIMGMKKAEIEEKFDDIVKFSEIEKFLDTPVKRYSSGMYVRLAFAVAAHLDPEILIVDEVLAVGDAAFQKKCLGKMGEVAKHGRTVLFVSHNMGAIQNLCKKSLLLDKGQIIYSGETEDTISQYIKLDESIKQLNIQDRTDRKGSQVLKFTGVSLHNSNGEEISRILSGDDIRIRIYYESQEYFNNSKISVAFNVQTIYGTVITNLNTDDTGKTDLKVYKSGYFECIWPKFNLRSGTYVCTLFCSIDDVIADWLQSAFSISVEEGDFHGTGKIIDRSQGDILITHYWDSFEEKA